MPIYVRVVHRGRGDNVRVEIPDGSTRLISRYDFEHFWTQGERNPDATPYHRTRRTVSNTRETVTAPDVREYIRIVHRGRGDNVRLLLPDGNTCLIPRSEFNEWTYVGVGEAPSLDTPSTQRVTFVNPSNQADRIYLRVVRAGSHNVSVILPDNTLTRIPRDIFYRTWMQENSWQHREWMERSLYPNGRSLCHLTFGIELEFIARPEKLNDFCDAMKQSLGQDRFDCSLRYGRSSTQKWVLGVDSSVASTRQGVSKSGYELTSPILHYDSSSKEELTKVLNIINNVFDGEVNKTCGTHIHIGNFADLLNGISDSVYRKCQSFQRMYGHLENSIFDRITSRSRRGDLNRYCRSCNTSVISSRYYKINLEKLGILHTIENRQHQGTLETRKIWSWMELNGKFILKFFNNPSSFDQYQYYSPSMENFFNFIGLDQPTITFFLQREAELC